jgi:hypothetical protein
MPLRVAKEVEIVIFNQRAQPKRQAAVPTGVLAMMLIATPFSRLRVFSTSTKWAVADGPIEDPRSRRISVPGLARAPMTDRLLRQGIGERCVAIRASPR